MFNARPLLGFALLIGPAAQAAPPAADTPAVAVVRRFLAARAAGKFDAAYGLLSSSTRQMISASEFAAGHPPTPRESKGMTPASLGVVNIFIDTHNTLHSTFTVVGPDPADPNTVLIRASPSAALLRLVTVADPPASVRRVDFAGSIERTAPKEFADAREKARQAWSQFNLRQLALGVMRYEQDHDERAPDADKWADQILPYVKATKIFHDPSAPSGEPWSYAYNRALSHRSLAEFEAPASTVMLFESTKGVKNASDTGQSVPRPGRHRGGTDYAFADGHVKWLPDGTALSYTLNGK